MTARHFIHRGLLITSGIMVSLYKAVKVGVPGTWWCCNFKIYPQWGAIAGSLDGTRYFADCCVVLMHCSTAPYCILIVELNLVGVVEEDQPHQTDLLPISSV